jgi:hypothetical protein
MCWAPGERPVIGAGERPGDGRHGGAMRGQAAPSSLGSCSVHVEEGDRSWGRGDCQEGLDQGGASEGQKYIINYGM